MSLNHPPLSPIVLVLVVVLVLVHWGGLDVAD